MGRETDGGIRLGTQPLAQYLKEKRSELMVGELEAVALRLFEERGFNTVTVQDIAAEAQISVRTFYRYFPAKEDVLQLRIDRRAEALRAALSASSTDDPPLHTVRVALVELVSADDLVHLRRWITVVAATPSVLRGVVGGIFLKIHQVLAEFFGARLGLPSEDLIPTMLAAATGSVMQAAQTKWFLGGGDLVTMTSESLAVLEGGIGTDPRRWIGDGVHSDGPDPTADRRSPNQAVK
jgi:AcrR family transcriptional regulator